MKRERVPDRRQEDVAARFVGLGLERELELVALRDRVLAEEVERVAEPLDRFLRVLARVRLGAFASAPEHVRLGAELDAEVHRAHGLLERVRADARVVARERAVAKHRVAEQVGRRHRHAHAGIAQRLLEVANDLVALGRGRVARHEIVVVQVDAVRAELAELADDLRRRDGRTHGIAERIAPWIADRPQAEGEVVFRLWRVRVRT